MDELKLKKYPLKNEAQKKAEAYARYTNAAVSLVEELDAILRALSHQRERVEQEILATKFYDKNNVVSLKELTLSYSSAVTAKIKLDKHMKQIADSMTYDEQVAAVINFVQVMDTTERSAFLRDMINYHNGQRLGLPGAPSSLKVED